MKSIFARLFSATPAKGVIRSIIDWEDGSNIGFYLKNEDSFFVGHFKMLGSDDGMICIKSPTKYDLAGKELYSHRDDPDAYIVLPVSDAKYIKIFN